MWTGARVEPPTGRAGSTTSCWPGSERSDVGEEIPADIRDGITTLAHGDPFFLLDAISLLPFALDDAPKTAGIIGKGDDYRRVVTDGGTPYEAVSKNRRKIDRPAKDELKKPLDSSDRHTLARRSKAICPGRPAISPMRRRTLLGTVAGLSLAGLAGCSDDGSASADTPTPDENEILVGPDNSFNFTPETVTISTGTTVTWRFASGSHNVSCDPDHHEKVSLPDDAEPFASYDGADKYSTVSPGETFTHTFEVAGTYEYVCVPHATSGMEGTVEVQEG